MIVFSNCNISEIIISFSVSICTYHFFVCPCIQSYLFVYLSNNMCPKKPSSSHMSSHSSTILSCLHGLKFFIVHWYFSYWKFQECRSHWMELTVYVPVCKLSCPVHRLWTVILKRWLIKCRCRCCGCCFAPAKMSFQLNESRFGMFQKKPQKFTVCIRITNTVEIQEKKQQLYFAVLT